jgi:hypothetical protein
MADKSARSAVRVAVAAAVELAEKIETTAGRIAIGTMHRPSGWNSAPSLSCEAETR